MCFIRPLSIVSVIVLLQLGATAVDAMLEM